jgi:hypothetical protein
MRRTIVRRLFFTIVKNEVTETRLESELKNLVPCVSLEDRWNYAGRSFRLSETAWSGYRMAYYSINFRCDPSSRFTGHSFITRKWPSFFTLFPLFSEMTGYGVVLTLVFVVFSPFRPFVWIWLIKKAIVYIISLVPPMGSRIECCLVQFRNLFLS